MFLKLLKLNTIAAKISLIPAVGVSCFLVFLTTVTISGNDTVSKLSSLEDEFYPKLLISDSRITLLGKISESFVTAAITGDMDSVTKAETLYADIVEVNKKLSTLDPKNSVQHKEYIEKLEEYFALARWISKALLGESEGGKMPGAEDRKKMTSTLQELEAHYKTFRASAQKSLDSTINDAQASSNRVIKLGVLIGIVSIVLSVVATIPVNRTITSSLRRVTESLESFSSGNGDLTVRLPTANIKEIAQLSSAFNQFISKLNRTFSRVIELSSQLSSHAFEVSSAAEETSVISGIQSQNAKKAKENINGMMQEIDLISQNSVKAENYSNKSHNNAESGLGIFSNTVSQITNMKDSAKSAVDDMGNLLADVSRVTNILDVIQNITSQTNLLALNAAIEAARAGEKGRGFAVVADEVRVLATRTQESATDIQSMFENLQEGTKLVSNTLDGSREKAEASFSEMGKANDSLREITSDIASIQSVSTDIAEAALKQVEMTKVFSKTIEDMMVSSSENENASHELASVSSKLAELATELTSITSEFNV